MSNYLKVAGLLLVLATMFCGCGDIEKSATGATKTLSSISVSPASATVSLGSSQAFLTTAVYDDGTTALVRPSWSISPSLGTISTAGLFAASTKGTAVITASYSGKTATAAVTVTSPGETLVTIEVSPSAAKIRVLNTLTFSAVGKNASGESLAFSPAWAMTGDAIGSFSSSGTTATVDAVSEGTAVISCASSEITIYSYVTVEGFTVVITAESDTYVNEANTGASYESATSLTAGYLSAAPGTYYETYIRFSLTSLPGNITIETATLEVYPISAGTPAFQFWKLAGAFSSASTWLNRPTYGSFLLSKTFTAGQYNSVGGDGMDGLAREWYAAPAANYGLAIRQDGGDNGIITLLSKENITNPPILNINYKNN